MFGSGYGQQYPYGGSFPGLGIGEIVPNIFHRRHVHHGHVSEPKVIEVQIDRRRVDRGDAGIAHGIGARNGEVKPARHGPGVVDRAGILLQEGTGLSEVTVGKLTFRYASHRSDSQCG